MFHNIQIDLLILKTYYGQFTFTTKKSLHIIFKADFKFLNILDSNSSSTLKEVTGCDVIVVTCQQTLC